MGPSQGVRPCGARKAWRFSPEKSLKNGPLRYALTERDQGAGGPPPPKGGEVPKNPKETRSKKRNPPPGGKRNRRGHTAGVEKGGAAGGGDDKKDNAKEVHDAGGADRNGAGMGQFHRHRPTAGENHPAGPAVDPGRDPGNRGPARRRGQEVPDLRNDPAVYRPRGAKGPGDRRGRPAGGTEPEKTGGGGD